jgi:hypothetical protein
MAQVELTALCHNAPIVCRTVATLPLLAATLLLVACGKSAHLPSTPSKPADQHKAAAIAPSHLGRAATKVQAIALAKALNLRASDLPGFHLNTERTGSSRNEKALERNARACMGGKEVAPLAEAGSHTFEHTAQILSVSVSSSVEVARTPAQALAELNLLRGARASGCLKAFVGRLLALQSKGGTSLKIVSVVKGSPPAPGTSGSYGWLITGRASTHGVQIPLYMDIFGFDYGQAMVSLFSFGLTVPFPPRAESELFSLLVERAKTGGGGKLGRSGKALEPSGPRQVQISL